MDTPGSIVYSTSPPEIPQCENPYFDWGRNAWILSRYTDISAALRDPRLGPSSPGQQGELGAVDPADHAEFRRSAKLQLSATRIDEWLASSSLLLHEIYKRFDLDRSINLVTEFAEPWALQLALTVTEADPRQGERLNNLARDIFTAAGDPYNQARQTLSARATQDILAILGDPLKLQMFVALAHTLPAFLASAWLALLLNPSEIQTLIDRPDILPNAIEELLRYAGPSRAQFRRALSQLTVDGTEIRKGDSVILMLASANHDEDEFPEPKKLNVQRMAPNHVAFGGGRHSCLGAALIRAAAIAATRPLLHYLGGAKLCGDVSWRGGMAIWSPESILVSPRT